MLLLLSPCVSMAQSGEFYDDYSDARPPSQVSDSIIVAFHRDFGKNKYELLQLVDDIMQVQYYETENEEGHSVTDSVCCDINGVYKFCRIRKAGNKILAEYHTGSYGDVNEMDEWDYYYDNGRLLQTIYTHHRKSADGLDDFGVYEFVEEKRVIFEHSGKSPLYIVREGEGLSQQFNIGEVQFEQFDIKHLIYDKYMFETVGTKILNHDKNI